MRKKEMTNTEIFKTEIPSGYTYDSCYKHYEDRFCFSNENDLIQIRDYISAANGDAKTDVCRKNIQRDFL